MLKPHKKKKKKLKTSQQLNRNQRKTFTVGLSAPNSRCYALNTFQIAAGQDCSRVIHRHHNSCVRASEHLLLHSELEMMSSSVPRAPQTVHLLYWGWGRNLGDGYLARWSDVTLVTSRWFFWKMYLGQRAGEFCKMIPVCLFLKLAHAANRFRHFDSDNICPCVCVQGFMFLTSATAFRPSCGVITLNRTPFNHNKYCLFSFSLSCAYWQLKCHYWAAISTSRAPVSLFYRNISYFHYSQTSAVGLTQLKTV